MSYTVGTTLQLSATFRRVSDNSLYDPTTVTCQILLPDNTTTAPSVTRVSVGLYTADYAPSLNGLHNYEFTGTGAVDDAVVEGSFLVGTSNQTTGKINAYLTNAELGFYGAALTTTQAQLQQASMLIDAYLKRPEGLIYVPDVNGIPSYMLRKPAGARFTVPAGLAPGNGVVATVVGPTSMIKNGTVLVCDKASDSLMESLSVIAVSGQQVTFATVQRTHATDVTLDDGLVIFDTKQMPNNRPLMLLPKNPVRNILKAQGRYAYNRRGSSANYSLNEYNLLAVMTQFGGPPVWEEINVTVADFNPQTGEVWVPAGIMLAYYTEVRVYYVSGYLAAEIPDAVKFAVANIINTQVNVPLQGNLKSMKAGDTTLERFMDTIFDSDTRDMLAPYRARTYA